MEPWEEALDIDDSDIPSLLRPCKRLHHQTTISSVSDAAPATTSLSQPLLKPCSNHPQTLIDQEQTEQKQQEPEQEEEESRPNLQYKSERRRTIPGPAGAVQSAMLQKTLDREKERLFCSQSGNISPISTQQYIRRAVENAPENDEDFSSNPWLSALEFVGTVDGVVPSIPLRSINQCINVGKADKIVAVIKSCTQSVGGLMVILKDPTGTIGASVHHKVLTESQFAKDCSIGSVLVLQKVAIFAPSKSLHYLNIMPRNLVKAFNKDNGPQTKQNSLAYSVKYVAPGEECFGKAGSPQNMFTPENGTCEEFMDGKRKQMSRRGGLDVNNQIEDENLLSQSLTSSSRSSLKANVVDKVPSTLRQDAAVKGFSYPKVVNPIERMPDDGTTESLMTNHVVQEIQGDNREQNPRQQLTTTTLPQWTDEQLKELFAGDDEDDDSIF